MRIAVDEPRLEDHCGDGSAEDWGDLGGDNPERIETLGVCHLNAVDPLHGEQTARGELRVDGGNVHVLPLCKE